MKKQMSENAKKLSKKDLKNIVGGVKLCMQDNACTQSSSSCHESTCKPGGGGPVKCTDILNKCVVYSMGCIEPQCHFDTGSPF